jgi:hypothetical protein
MLSNDQFLRPDCQQILNEKSEWILNLNKLKDEIEFQNIIRNKIKTQSLEKCFHHYFIQQKFDYFFKGLTAAKQSIQGKNVDESWQMWNRIPIESRCMQYEDNLLISKL